MVILCLCDLNYNIMADEPDEVGKSIIRYYVGTYIECLNK